MTKLKNLALNAIAILIMSTLFASCSLKALEWEAEQNSAIAHQSQQ